MKYVSIVFGILAFLFMLVGLIPCLGWSNWILTLPFSVIGLIMAGFLYQQSDEAKQDNSVKIGLFLNGCAFVVGVIRLFVGGGIL